jgi:hypothetical protein
MHRHDAAPVAEITASHTLAVAQETIDRATGAEKVKAGIFGYTHASRVMRGVYVDTEFPTSDRIAPAESAVAFAIRDLLFSVAQEEVLT